MKQRSTFSKKELQFLPIGFQFFKELNYEELKNIPKPKCIKVEIYGTDFCIPRNIYKPISKVFHL